MTSTSEYLKRVLRVVQQHVVLVLQKFVAQTDREILHQNMTIDSADVELEGPSFLHILNRWPHVIIGVVPRDFNESFILDSRIAEFIKAGQRNEAPFEVSVVNVKDELTSPETVFAGDR